MWGGDPPYMHRHIETCGDICGCCADGEEVCTLAFNVLRVWVTK